MGSKIQSLAGRLASLPDPRKTRGQRHVVLHPAEQQGAPVCQAHRPGVEHGVGRIGPVRRGEDGLPAMPGEQGLGPHGRNASPSTRPTLEDGAATPMARASVGAMSTLSTGASKTPARNCGPKKHNGTRTS